MIKTLALASALAFAAPAFAGDLVNTGAPTSGYSGSIGLYGANPTYQTEAQSVAGEVTFDDGATINSIETFGYNYSFTGLTTIAIYASNGTIPTGDALFSGTFNAPYTGTANGQWMGLSGLDWTLGAGSYFVAFEAAPAGTGFSGGLGTDTPNPLAHYAFTGDGGAWNADHGQGIALRIEGTVGVASLAVPEPASWALMLVGFGAVGGAMRTRSRRAVAAA